MKRNKWLAVVLLAVACKSGAKSDRAGDNPAGATPAKEDQRERPMGVASVGAEAPPSVDMPAKGPASPTTTVAKPGYGEYAAKDEDGKEDKKSERNITGNGARRPEGVTRAWFPETFLFEPRIVTDEQGAGSIDVRVPDRLTTWRVLALAHAQNGAQGGAVTSFLGTLPTYIDPIVPKFLVVGDEVRLPIQMINTTDAAVQSTFEIGATNATVSGASGARTIPALGNLVEYASLKADHAGTIMLRTALGSTDAVVRTIDVVPSGKPMTVTASGTLAAPRTLKLDGPAGSVPSTDRARLMVFPGALALLRAELGASSYREGIADDAYALLLAGRAPALLAALGDKADPEALRNLTILTSQRAIRDGRNLDITSASLLTEAAVAHAQNPVLARLGERAAAYLAQNQRPDGTFGGGNGWSLDRVLVATADGSRAVGTANATPTERQRALAVATRAAGAFERNLKDITEPYTAAAILASGAVTGPVADKLRELVSKSIKASGDGAKYLAIGTTAIRADGSTPSQVEATALAVLALQGDPKAPLADLGATLLGSYSPDRGWGDGRTNLACIDAVMKLFKDPVPANVKITLTMDGKPISEGILDRDKLKDVLVLDTLAPGLAGAHEWSIVAEPAVPGLGYSLALKGWVPWETEAVHSGLELQLPPSISGTVGKPSDIAIAAIAPAGVPLHITQALPAGVQVDTPSLQALVAAGTLTRFETAEGKVDFYTPGLQVGQMFKATYRVIPTLGGKLHSSASFIEAGPNQFHVPPTEWTIR
ncbi:MAG: hypothetical protein JWO36_5074 [Myxococcales bacterium]|nr:hypothetical protein [Myxococcales bacterium]